MRIEAIQRIGLLELRYGDCHEQLTGRHLWNMLIGDEAAFSDQNPSSLIHGTAVYGVTSDNNLVFMCFAYIEKDLTRHHAKERLIVHKARKINMVRSQGNTV